ncbi:MAG TPA: aa3-type cytochrome c oxidase subunit IV [Allosphingosinicella sp.]|jgi:hypothetical protein
MAAEGEVRSDIKAHRSGYSLFVSIMKWGSIASFLVAMVVVFLISS